MQPTRCGLIGYGAWGQHHARAITATPDARLTAICAQSEKSVSQAKENYEKLKAAAEEASDVMEETYSTATKGSTEYGLKVLDAARVNTNAAFDFFAEFIAVKSLSEAVELSTAHARKQFEMVTEQTKDLTAIAQKVASDTTEPVKAGVTKAFSKVA